MYDVEIREAHYGQGGLYYRHGPQRLIQRLHQRTTSTYRPPYDPSVSHGVWKSEEPQIPLREILLSHCGPEEVPNARGKFVLQRPPKRCQETNA